MAQDPKSAIVKRLKAEGFDVVRTTTPARVIGTASRLGDWLEAEFHGTMVWMKERRELRGHPENLWPDTRSIIVVGSNYGPEYNPLDLLDQKECAAISAYAQNRDYHDVMKGKLKQTAQWFASTRGQRRRPSELNDDRKYLDWSGDILLSAFQNPLAEAVRGSCWLAFFESCRKPHFLKVVGHFGL